jgi:nucleoside-diphosphate-sugar epimerase
MGYDPLLQALHPDDAVDALVRALDRPEAQGVFNIAPEGVVPLSTVRLLFGSLGIPVPHPLGYALYEAAWLAGVGLMPGVHANYFRYLCVVDDAKARRVLGFSARYTTLEVVLETARARFGEGRLVNFAAVADAARSARYTYEQHVRPHPRPRTQDAATGAAS